MLKDPISATKVSYPKILKGFKNNFYTIHLFIYFYLLYRKFIVKIALQQFKFQQFF
jgi:hypothetical protein